MFKDLFTALTGVVVLLLLTLTPLVSGAFELPGVPANPLGTHPFGGIVKDKTRCECCGITYGHVISVGPPKEGDFMLFGLGSKIFEYKKVEKGEWVLGLAKGPDLPCLKTVSCFRARVCVPKTKKGPYISIIGTSNRGGFSLPSFSF